MADAWTKEEVVATVEAYFEMLALELDDRDFNKAEYNRNLRTHLNNRTKAAVELKHQNISAVLDSLGLRFINGYKPKGNYQALLRESVQAHLASYPGLQAKLKKPAEGSSGISAPVVLLVGSLLATYALCG